MSGKFRSAIRRFVGWQRNDSLLCRAKVTMVVFSAINVDLCFEPVPILVHASVTYTKRVLLDRGFLVFGLL